MKCCMSYFFNPTVCYSIFCRFPWYDVEEAKETGMYMLDVFAVMYLSLQSVMVHVVIFIYPSIAYFF